MKLQEERNEDSGNQEGTYIKNAQQTADKLQGKYYKMREYKEWQGL